MNQHQKTMAKIAALTIPATVPPKVALRVTLKLVRTVPGLRLRVARLRLRPRGEVATLKASLVITRMGAVQQRHLRPNDFSSIAGLFANRPGGKL